MKNDKVIQIYWLDYRPYLWIMQEMRIERKKGCEIKHNSAKIFGGEFCESFCSDGL